MRQYTGCMIIFLLFCAGGWAQGTNPNCPYDNHFDPIRISPASPTYSSDVNLTVSGLLPTNSARRSLVSVTNQHTAMGNTVEVYVATDPQSSTPETQNSDNAKWRLGIDLGNLSVGFTTVVLYVNNQETAQETFEVVLHHPNEKRLVYNESGGFIGLQNNLTVRYSNDYEVTLWNPPVDWTSIVDWNSAIKRCKGTLTEEEEQRLVGIFETHGFAGWEDYYGPVDNSSLAISNLGPIIADGFFWHIRWEGKSVAVVEGATIPEFVMALITDLNVFAKDLFGHCPPVLAGEIKDIDPRSPLDSDEVTITVGGDMPEAGYTVVDSTLEQRGHELKYIVNIVYDASAGGVRSWTRQSTIGPLEAGYYHVKLEINGRFCDAKAIHVKKDEPPVLLVSGHIKDITPAHPGVEDRVTIKAGGHLYSSHYQITGSEMVRHGNTLSIAVEMTLSATTEIPTLDPSSVAVPWMVEHATGPLPAGRYEVNLCINNRKYDRRCFMVGDSTSPVPSNNVIVLVHPDVPTASTPVSLSVMGVFSEPRKVITHSATREGQMITVNITSATQDSPGGSNPSNGNITDRCRYSWRIVQRLDILPMDDYMVSIVMDGTPIGQKSFSVLPADPTLASGVRAQQEGINSIDVDTNGTIDHMDLFRLIRYWHLE
jgi:hypothetical protein